MAGAPSIGVLLLRDLHRIFRGHDKMPTETILEALHGIEESPWADLHGKPVDARWLSRQLTKYSVKPKVIRTATGTPRGYDAADLADPWTRYVAPPEGAIGKLGEEETPTQLGLLPLSPIGPATSATPQHDRTCPTPGCSARLVGQERNWGRCADHREVA